jgi:hypothetical protein
VGWTAWLGITVLITLIGIPIWLGTRPAKRESFEEPQDINHENLQGGYSGSGDGE